MTQTKPAFVVTKKEQPIGEVGVRFSLEEVARRATKGRLDPHVRAWTMQKLKEARDSGQKVDRPIERAKVLLSAIRKEFVYAPDPTHAEFMTGPHLLVQGVIPGGDCDDLTILTIACFLAASSSVGLRCAVVGHAYDNEQNIQHVLAAVFDGDKWHYADPSTDSEFGEWSVRPSRERVIDVPCDDNAEAFCDADMCLVGLNSIGPPPIQRTGDFVGVDGLPTLGEQARRRGSCTLCGLGFVDHGEGPVLMHSPRCKLYRRPGVGEEAPQGAIVDAPPNEGVPADQTCGVIPRDLLPAWLLDAGGPGGTPVSSASLPGECFGEPNCLSTYFDYVDGPKEQMIGIHANLAPQLYRDLVNAPDLFDQFEQPGYPSPEARARDLHDQFNIFLGLSEALPPGATNSIDLIPEAQEAIGRFLVKLRTAIVETHRDASQAWRDLRDFNVRQGFNPPFGPMTPVSDAEARAVTSALTAGDMVIGYLDDAIAGRRKIVFTNDTLGLEVLAADTSLIQIPPSARIGEGQMRADIVPRPGGPQKESSQGMFAPGVSGPELAALSPLAWVGIGSIAVISIVAIFYMKDILSAVEKWSANRRSEQLAKQFNECMKENKDQKICLDMLNLIYAGEKGEIQARTEEKRVSNQAPNPIADAINAVAVVGIAGFAAYMGFELFQMYKAKKA